MHRACGVFFEMHARYLDAVQFSARDERVLVLRELVALRQVGIKIVLAVEFRVICEFCLESKPYPQNVPYSFRIDYGECAWMGHAYGADIHVGLRRVCVVLGAAKHLGFGFQFCMDFEAYSRDIFAHTATLSHKATTQKGQRLRGFRGPRAANKETWKTFRSGDEGWSQCERQVRLDPHKRCPTTQHNHLAHSRIRDVRKIKISRLPR